MSTASPRTKKRCTDARRETARIRGGWLVSIGCFLLVFTVIGCSPSLVVHPPGRSVDHPALHRGVPLEVWIVSSTPFEHLVVSKPDCTPPPDEPRLFFIDGDGETWIRDGEAPVDATPLDPIALDLMIADAGCGLYISRPCTFDLGGADCDVEMRTLGRYSTDVIDSLSGVLEVASMGSRIVLVGYSGGGLLAAQLAQRNPRVEGLITLGANLDLAAWIALHGYTPTLLERSAKPAWPLRADLRQLHVFGGRDRNVPPSLMDGLEPDPHARVWILERADHACCWLEAWPRIRARFDETPPGR